MTRAEQFELCYKSACKIVQRYRSEAPEGCDPQNTGAAAATVIIGVTSAALAEKQRRDEAKKQAALTSGMMNTSGEFKELKLPQMPPFIANNIPALNADAIRYNTAGYNASDTDFKRRHKPIVESEKLFEQQVLKDQQGEHELMPLVQNEFMRAGLQGSLSAFGDTPNILAPGSAAEAGVARQFGNEIAAFQDRNRENRTKSLVTAEELFPRREFGLSGSDAVNLGVGNTAGINNWNQADYANKVQLAQYNATGQANFNNSATAMQNNLATVTAQANAERTKAIISAVEMATKLGSQAYGSYRASHPATANTAGASNPYAGTGINTNAPVTSWKANSHAAV